MHHSRRKSFDWYGLKQHFSIRKYHFGAASVLLGMSIALGTGTQVVQAAETVTTPESTSVASSTSATESTTSETSTETATSSSSERTVEIGYIVKYATEDGTLVNASVETVSVTTTETIAKATVSVTAVVPEGYELAAGQAATVSQEVTENGQNIVTVKVVKKVEASATVSSPTTTSTTVATASSTTRAAASPTPTTPTTPTTVEEAKKVLEQVTSEAEVLANETNRLVAADNTNEVLKTAAAATKLVATKATVTFQNAFATLEEVNAQISAVRTSVEALVLELRKFLGTDVIDIALTTVTDMNDSTNRPGYWTENEEVLNKAAATATATTKPQKQNIPAGYEVDPTDGRITFLIYSLSADDVDVTVTPGTKDGSYNKRYGTDYYITLSMDRVKTTGNIYARLVSKQKGLIEEIEIPENTARHQFQKIANGPKELGEFTYRMSLTTMPFTDSTGQQTSVRYVNINSGVGANGKGSVAYSLLTNDNTSYNSYTGLAPSYTPFQVTSYFVKETERRAQELLASYAHVAMVSGDSFTISDAAEFANYELIEAPVIKDTLISTNYSVGTPLIQYFPASKTARVIYITKEDGTSRFLNFVLNPDHPDFLENFKNYHSMSQVDFVTNGGAEALDFTNRIAIVNKYLAEIEAVNADTSLASDVQASRLAEIRANYASEINTDDNKFLLTFVSTEAEPQSANDGPDAVTGLTTWTHTVKNYYTLYSHGNLVTTIAFKIGSYMSDPMVDWSPTDPTPQGAKLHSKTELDKNGIAARVKITVNQDGVEKEVGADLQSNIIAMYNMLTGSENNQNYYYAEKGGVKVYYVDTEGNVLQDSKSIYDHANTNTAYDTKSVKDATITTADGTVYYYKEIDTADLHPASSNTDTEKRKIEKITEEVGTVAQDTLKELTYVYEKAGNVNVNYVDVDGNKLSGTDGTGKVVTEKVADLVNAKAGTGYDTIVDNRPAKIVTADGKTYELAPAAEYTVGTVEADHHLSVSNVTEVTGVHEATGSVASGITKEITFVYKEVTGKVIVNFKSIDGEVLQGPRTDTEEGSTGRDYNTEGEGEVPPTITKDGKTYKLVPNLTNGNPTGKVTPGTTEVTYYYQLVTGDVVVNYENTDGKTIAQQKVDVNNGNIGDAYDTRDEGDKPEKIVEDGTGDVYYIKPAGTEVKIGNGLSGETGRVVEGTTQVTYIYEKAGNVKINYILDDAAGTTLKDSVMDEENAKPGTAYDTTDEGDKPETITKDGKVYRLKEVKADSAAENGDTAKIVAGTTLEVTYVYTEVKSDVVVEYYDTEGNLLTGKTDTGGNVDKRVTDTTQASVGTPYNTDEDHRPATITTADGTIYHYIELKEGSAQPEGTVAETTTTVQYVYAKAGSVVIRYVKEDDKGIQSELQPNVLDEDNVKPGTPYDTTDEGNKPTTITTEDGKTYTLVRKEGHDETGEVAAGETKEITYVYKEVTGKVIVHYVDQDGNPISGTTDEGKKTASTVTDTPESSTGTPYDTKDLKPKTITTDDGKIYKLVPAATQGNETGKVVVGTTEITYVYELVQGDVIVHYVDTEGNTIADDVTDQTITDTGTDYDTRDNKPEKIVNDETGDVYYILPKDEVKAGDKETGKVVEGTTEVTYIYEKAGSVNVNYVDTEGNVLKDPVADVTDGKPGSGYDTVLDNKLASISVDGKLYRLAPANTYNVGTVSDDNNLTAVGNGKATGIDATTGTVEAGVTKEITYVYQEVKGDVVVEYYDTEGNQIAKTVVDEDDKSVGTVYNTDEDNKPETITTEDGTVYYYKEVKDTSAPTTGKVAETTTTVQYVYEKAGSVNVNYVDTDGNPIQAPVADETNEKAGTEYATADNKPTTITTADGKTYRLVEAGTYNVGTVSDDNNLTAVGNGKATGIDATTGTVEAGTTKEITYVYEEVKGNVVVNYITTDGTVIKQPVEDTPTSSTGTPYDTKDNKPTTITTEDGKTYRIVPVLTKGSETGKVVEGTTSITYVYEEVKGDVVVEYYDTEGNLISGLSDSGEAVDTKEVDTPSTSTGTAYNTDEDHKPNTITTADGTVYYYKEVKDTSASTTGKVVEGTTTVQYVYEKAGNVIVHYITEDGTVIKATVTDEENAKPGKSYDTTDNKPTEIVTEDGSRYVLIPSKTIGTENGTVEGGKTIEITYVYKKVANWIPQIPGVPEGQEPKVPYPFDPTNPDVPVTPTPDTVIPNVPGYTPVDPKTNEPLKPVDPTDPSKGYVPPTPDETGVDTPIPYVQNGNVVVNYVTEDGTVIKAPVKDETDAPAGKSYDATDNKPVEIVTEDGSRYVLIPSKTVGSETGTVEGGKTIEITYVYKKVANWIPQIPGVPEGQEPKVPYPFDPTNPDVPVTPTPDTVIPNVPGYTPVDPKTNEPLKPVDPTDPGKGYVPPTPDDSGVDTPVPYVQNGNVVVNYVDENGNVLKTPVNDETDAPAGKSYDTTDNKPVEIVTEDGSRYVLIPSKTVGSETGTVEGGKTTEVTYVYRKVETPAKKVVTNHVDEDGNPIAPQEEGTTPNKSIPGYEFTGKTVTDPDGNTTHIYRKVTKVVTNHVDEDGNPITPQEEGTTPNKSIPGYEFTGKTVTDPDGNTTHIYRKVSKPVAPKPQAPVAPTTAKAGAAQLPNTGEASSSATVLGAGMLIAALALAGKRRRNED
ncbi:MucBP domain-containing protein [Streptococcus suis]|uniref:MucBP domain-containing protein n=1 Tax=Streptococcus suis TaxID=1307 RepID=UPI00211BF42B|nr:MucBP domain-containing protein [Streptococcus suis]MCQ9226030.1 MucBP domain-containing protein [Streptococcus suis]MCQ9228338.1 MucBP domain-containing protein [Streptococcus suis]MCQ9241312.1 MucBP domain-containing protein [Streptococcus suis]MCQ9274549.1 MucBP domain-containing protein [Streptococcus suis]MDE7535559.1 MucBP domain-containing protein [Streptococcus suis]